MNCLIIAAGNGSRLRPVSESKPLTCVGGVPLIERAIRRALAAGAARFVVVTGHEAERVERFLAGLSARLGVAIDCARTADWHRPNGHSVLAGAEAIEGGYLLLMGDHLFDPEIPRRLLREGLKGELTLAVDRDLAGPLLDLDDATRVETGAGGAILKIGKALARYDAVDTGIFLAGPGLAEAIRADIDAGGEGCLSAGVQRLADRGLAGTMEVGGSRWIDVDDPRMLALAEAHFGAAAGIRDNAA